MVEKINISSLIETENHIGESLRIIRTLDMEQPLVQTVRYRLSLMKKTLEKLILSAESDDFSHIFIRTSQLPQIHWLRSAAVGIKELISQKPKLFDPLLSVEITDLYRIFNAFCDENRVIPEKSTEKPENGGYT